MLDTLIAIFKLVPKLLGKDSKLRPKNRRGRDQIDALRLENKMLREDAEKTKRDEDIKNEIETTDEDGNPTGLDFDNIRGK